MINLETSRSPSQLNDLGCSCLEGTIPFLEFSIEIESNDLTYHQKYTKRQELVYELIKYLLEEKGLGYRRISQSPNRWGIPTQRSNKWFNTSVFSVLKRKRQRDERIENLRNKEFETHISKFELKYHTFD